MAQLVKSGAMLECTFGDAPASLMVTPEQRVNAEGAPAANIMDHIPIENIPSFGMCNAESNPEVEAATALACGVPTPVPCIPATTMPWTPGSPNVMLGRSPALNNTSKCICMWAGEISIVDPGTEKTDVS
jgi:hypothetical protein